MLKPVSAASAPEEVLKLSLSRGRCMFQPKHGPCLRHAADQSWAAVTDVRDSSIASKSALP